MLKISNESKFIVVSGRRQKVNTDSSFQNELGWGAHTMELVIVIVL